MNIFVELCLKSIVIILSLNTEHISILSLTKYLSFWSFRGTEFLFLLISVTFSLYLSCRSVWACIEVNSENVSAGQNFYSVSILK